MYTVYFLLEYSYGSFKHPVYVQLAVKDGARFRILEDTAVLKAADVRVQVELNEYFKDMFTAAQDCGIEMYIISAQEYNDAPNIFLKIVV